MWDSLRWTFKLPANSIQDNCMKSCCSASSFAKVLLRPTTLQSRGGWCLFRIFTSTRRTTTHRLFDPADKSAIYTKAPLPPHSWRTGLLANTSTTKEINSSSIPDARRFLGGSRILKLGLPSMSYPTVSRRVSGGTRYHDIRRPGNRDCRLTFWQTRSVLPLDPLSHGRCAQDHLAPIVV